MVSVMEAHSPASRGLLDQQRIEDEMCVSWNGEDIYHCDGVVGEAMRMYKGNFIRRSGRVNDYFVSSVRSSSGYPCLLRTYPAQQQPTFPNFSNSSDSKVKVKVKGPNMCYIFTQIQSA